MAELDARKGRYEEAIAKLRKVLEGEVKGCKANWYTIDRPWAEELLQEIAEKKDARK